MVRASEGGSRCVPMSLACDGIVCARMCLTKDVECLPCSVRVVRSRRLVCVVGPRVVSSVCLCGWAGVWVGAGRVGGSETVASVACLVCGGSFIYLQSVSAPLTVGLGWVGLTL